MKVEIVLPEKKMDELGDGLVALTAAIDSRDPDAVAHGFLGGEHGYGAHFDCDTFTMRPYYWGDCDCDSDKRERDWEAANPHADTCFRSERARRWKAYDDSVAWTLIEREAFGDHNSPFGGMNVESEPIVFDGVEVGVSSVMTPRNDAAMRRWRKAHDARDKAQAKIVADLYRERGLKPETFQWLCTCGVDERRKMADINHRPTCAVELPNFIHKPSGFEVRWYKYIGRGMEAKGDPPSFPAMFAECAAAIAHGLSSPGADAANRPSTAPVTQAKE